MSRPNDTNPRQHACARCEIDHPWRECDDDLIPQQQSSPSIAELRHQAAIARTLRASKTPNYRELALAEALRLILPMAKAYAHANQVGNNQEFIEQAETALAAWDKEAK